MNIFKVFPNLPTSQSDEGNFWENFENTQEINPQLPESICDYLREFAHDVCEMKPFQAATYAKTNVTGE